MRFRHGALGCMLALAAMPGLGVARAAAAGTDAGAGHATVKATELMFSEKVKDEKPYRSRFLITPDFMRSDYGAGSRDFVLLDRHAHTVYSVSHEDHTVLVIRHRDKMGKIPASLHLGEEHERDEKAPTIDGKTPVHFTFTADGSTCYNAVVVPGLLPDAVAAMREFQQVMAGQHAADMQKTPKSMRTPCYLARYIYASDRHLRHGMPIQEWDPKGYRRMLVDYKRQVTVDAGLFKLPEGFKRYSVN